MSITDELRAWIDSITWLDDSVSQAHKKILAIADRIDVEYAAYRAAVDGMLKEYVKLPVDEDGVPIKLGDIVDEFEVRRLVLIDKDTWEVEDRFGEPFNPSTLHHTVPDSWEDIITDALKFAGNGGVPVGANFADYAGEFVERCKRLAGEDA